MQIETTIAHATGNGKSVELSRNLNTHSGKYTYFMTVSYHGDPHLDFCECYDERSRGESAYATWRTLCD